MRAYNRPNDQLRTVKITRHYTIHAEGSVLIEIGNTRVLCTASIIRGVPRFLKEGGKGWLTAEYSMLPRATHERTEREAARGKLGGRTMEIQRLIGRAVRNAVDLSKMGENTLILDCDVLQADAGTRTAAITGGMIAIADALKAVKKEVALKTLLAATSVGIRNNQLLLDLDYDEDRQAEVDMNVVMTEQGELVEIQGSAEKRPFRKDQLAQMLELADSGIRELIAKQRQALEQD